MPSRPTTFGLVTGKHARCRIHGVTHRRDCGIIVRASIQQYRWSTPDGHWVEARVSETDSCSNVDVHMPADAVPTSNIPVCQWGVYRSSPMRPQQPQDVRVTPAASVNGASKLIPLEMTADGATYRLSATIPSSLRPVTLGFELYLYDNEGKSKKLRLGSSGRAAVPIGVTPGNASVLGATLVSMQQRGDGVTTHTVNFAVVSRSASAVSLVLVRSSGGDVAASSLLEVALDPHVHRCGDVWNCCLAGLKNLNTLYYGWRMDGKTADLNKFVPGAVLLDPYAAIADWVTLPQSPSSGRTSPTQIEGGAQALMGNLAAVLPNLLPAHGDLQRLNRPLESQVLLEVHVPTFSRHDSVEPQYQGTFMGVLRRLDRIKALGVNGVVLSTPMLCDDGQGAFGRAPLSLIAPDPMLSTQRNGIAAARELRQLIAALHERSIEVFLQVELVFTGEGSKKAVSMRGIDGSLYYRNADGLLNSGHAIVRTLILHALRHWSQSYRVDGFWLVNAEALCQDKDGNILDCPPLVESMARDPVLGRMKIVAAPNDASLLPRSGVRGFPHFGTILESSSRFAADMQAYVLQRRHGVHSIVATRLTGSPDLTAAQWDSELPGNLACGRRPAMAVNTIAPLLQNISLQQLWRTRIPHNEFPAEDTLHKDSSIRLLLLTTLLAQGMPCLPCTVADDTALARFVGVVVRMRKDYLDMLQPPKFDSPRDLRWHGLAAESEPDWEGSGEGRSTNYMAFSLHHPDGRSMYIGFNPEEVCVQPFLPPLSAAGMRWCCVVDTSKEPPHDAAIDQPQPLASQYSYSCSPCSGIVLVSQPAASLPSAQPFSTG